MKQIVSSLEETKDLAGKLAGAVTPDAVIGLTGDLGAGKTTFSRFFIQALGAMDPVSSPTFVIKNDYKASDLTIEHWDLYRLNEIPDELYEPAEPGTIRLIEWVDKFPFLRTEVSLNISISIGEGDSRIFEISD